VIEVLLGGEMGSQLEGQTVLREGWPGSQQRRRISGHGEDHSQRDGRLVIMRVSFVQR
jgi:hypothetical protein